ncbi:Hypothetical predicted protein [Paramuricea clavata]|uniref:Uncharacterized protein n=1 Tax=Paramuricea clavata TaxID=317549 RepID=A0A7D9JPV6_PARCT|nr:Hypothetical predicted protein [Paramuricea clavata]
MEECFDVGEKDKRKRHTTQSCQQLMETKLGKGSMLTTHQIESYWGAYKQKKMASCEGMKSSWISDLFDESKQLVMWLKDGKGILYKKFKECVKEGKKPISESKFHDGLKAGNFKRDG